MSFLSKLDLIAGFQKDKVHSFLTLFYSTAYLSKIAIAYPRLSAFLAKANREEEAFLYPSNQFATKEMKKSVFCMLQAGCMEEETSICIKKGRALEILIQALELTTHQPTSCPTGLTRQDIEKIYAAKDWLEQQYNRPVTLFELARTVGMNVHKLSAGFLQVTGTTVFNYHRNVRMNKAIKLLEETDLSLFDIGIEVGYMDGKSFSKEFKKENNISPFEYRRRTRVQNT
jgi:AraC-like DNA-binding protein